MDSHSFQVAQQVIILLMQVLYRCGVCLVPDVIPYASYLLVLDKFKIPWEEKDGFYEAKLSWLGELIRVVFGTFLTLLAENRPYRGRGRGRFVRGRGRGYGYRRGGYRGPRGPPGEGEDGREAPTEETGGEDGGPPRRSRGNHRRGYHRRGYRGGRRGRGDGGAEPEDNTETAPAESVPPPQEHTDSGTAQ